MVMLILSFGVKAKAVTSLLAHALLPASMNSALVLLDLALLLVVVVVAALLILDLITASGFTLVIAMIATTLMPIHMLDFPPSNPSVDLPTLDASPVPLTARVLVPKPLSASSTLAVVPEATLSLLLILMVRPLLVPRRVRSQSLVTLVPLTALTQLSSAALLVRTTALEDVWVEVNAATDLVSAIRVSRVRTVPLLLKKRSCDLINYIELLSL